MASGKTRRWSISSLVLAACLALTASDDYLYLHTASFSFRKGVPAVRVRITARLPLVGTLGPTALTVEGHAIQERP